MLMVALFLVRPLDFTSFPTLLLLTTLLRLSLNVASTRVVLLHGHTGPDAAGKVTGGHMGPGCMVRTTAEVLVMLLPGHRFSQEIDPATGYKELFVGPAESSIATSR